MKKSVNYSETIKFDDESEVDLNYDLDNDSIYMSIDSEYSLGALERLAAGLSKFIKDIKKDQKNGK